MQNGLGYVDYAEAARLLGIAEDTLRHYVSARKLPFYKIGSRVFFKPQELEDWIDSRKVEPARGR